MPFFKHWQYHRVASGIYSLDITLTISHLRLMIPIGNFLAYQAKSEERTFFRLPNGARKKTPSKVLKIRRPQKPIAEPQGLLACTVPVTPYLPLNSSRFEKIMVIEDDPSVRRALVTTLQRMDIPVLAVGTLPPSP